MPDDIYPIFDQHLGYQTDLSLSMKRKNSTNYLRIICIAALVFISNGCFKNLTVKNTVYTNDFEKNDLDSIKLYDIHGLLATEKIEQFNGSKVLGRFNNNALELALSDLPSHNAISIEFDLNIHDKWDGDGGGDIWQMNLDDRVILLTTFSNTTSRQSYPNFYLSGSYPARANAADITLPGVCGSQGIKGGTTSYKISKIIAHSSSTVKLHCNDALQPFNDVCLKSWSIDNLTITAIKY